LHLSGLELQGFKSFPRKTKITFSPGVMAIVGPNGCGKTNIVDAVRWVLGEQRSSVLRSEKMENVIFAGSGAQKQSKFAEVTLVIENSHGVLPAEYSEVAITRRLDREGDSEYLINKRPSRLKDIRNLFADTGLGPESYSIIELKMVEGILSSRTEERRRLFEEAAGVTLYKSRLKATRHKLSATEADMVRLEDVLSEVTTRRNSLKRQVAKARRYRYLREALRVKEITASSNEINELRTRIVPMEERLVRDRQTKTSLETQIEKGDLELAELRGRVTAFEEKLTELNRKRSDLEKRSQAIREEMVMLEERLRSGLSRSEERAIEENELHQRRQEIAVEIKDLDEDREKAKIHDEEIRMRLEAMNSTWTEYENRENEARRIRDRLESERRENENRLIRLDSEHAQIRSRIGQIEDKKLRLEEDDFFTNDAPDTDDISSDYKNLKIELDTLEEEINSKRESRETQMETRASIESDIAGIMRDLEAARKRVALLEGMVQGGEGRPKAVKALLKSGLKNLLGRLGDTVVVKEEDRIAVAAALENISSVIVTKDIQSFGEAAKFLKKDNSGRGQLAFLQDYEKNQSEPAFDGKVGVLGRLEERVKVKGDAGKILKRFLGNVWLVENLDTILDNTSDAIKSNAVLVSLDGSRFTPDGLLAVGKADPGDLGAADLLDQAKKELSDCENQQQSKEAELAKNLALEEEAVEIIKVMLRKRDEVRYNLEEKRKELSRIQADLQEYQALLNKRNQDSEALDKEHQTLTERLADVLGDLEEVRIKVSRSQSELDEAVDNVHNIQEEGRSLRNARDKIREKQVVASSTYERISGEVRRQGTSLEEIERRLERIKQEKIDSAGALEDAGERLRHVQAEEAVVERDLNEATDDVNKSQEEYNIIRRQFNELNGTLSEKRTDHSSLADRLHATEMEVADLKHRLSAVRERILEGYEIDLYTSKQEELPLAVEEDNPYMEKPLGEIRDSLKDIGPVNQMAVEEYEVVNGRWEQLTEQHGDLTEAIEVLRTTIKEINVIARERFLETFTRVEGHFVGLFSRLFGGGEAALSLAEGDPLEAGIQIYASPKGKKLSSIDLLSGGEKAMTAISLLFALYLERPSPFCFLDEVDAPLDDVNVVRFNRLLKEFTDRTQFLTVTHNKLTMERADRLYGVTMEDEGVSKMVTVEIGKIEREGVVS